MGGESNGALVSSVQMLRPNRAFGVAGAPGAGSPYFGAKLLIADRGNNRLLLLTDTNQVVWKYPSAKTPRDPLQFYFPDDAFFIARGTAIISNQEQNDTVVEIAYPSGKIIWSYGHPRQPGTARGYLHEPDDAYLLKNGQLTVADANNCRVLVLNHDGSVAHQIGTDGVCQHNPPASMGTPNGDTPLADGNLLISEINGSWVSEYTPAGKLVWTVQLPISYPSDPQQLGPNRYLIADYALPGQLLEFTRSGHILYRYRAASGPGMLNQPSLAEVLPSGVFMVNDDYNNRMVAFDPITRALVWQYGITGKHGTGPANCTPPTASTCCCRMVRRRRTRRAADGRSPPESLFGYAANRDASERGRCLPREHPPRKVRRIRQPADACHLTGYSGHRVRMDALTWTRSRRFKLGWRRRPGRRLWCGPPSRRWGRGPSRR